MQDLVLHFEKITNDNIAKLIKDNEKFIENFKPLRELILGWMKVDPNNVNYMIVTGSRCST